MAEPDGLWLDDLRISLDGVPLIGIDARIAPGETLTVMGPSGIGKSTILAATIGTLPPGAVYTGRILLNGRRIDGLLTEARRVGILFQDPLLFPHLSVGGNLAFALPKEVKPRAARQQRIYSALGDVGLADFADRDPATLSGGQKARVALARTLLADPEALLLDEPFSGLDMALRDRVRRMVFRMARDRGLPVLLVTHDESDASAAGGRVIHLKARHDDDMIDAR